MLAYHLKLAFRNLRHNLSFSFINILGLSVGLASCLLIFSYLSEQRSYDTFHAEYEKIYRIHQLRQKSDLPVEESATTISKVAHELGQSFSMVAEVCRLHKNTGNIAVKVGNKNFREENVMGVDESFFEVFDFPFVYGTASSSLSVPQGVVLTRSTAKKYFGDINPLGEEIIVDGAYGNWSEQGFKDRLSFQVAGVLEDLPKNTHMKFDILISFSMFANLEGELGNWGDTFYTYVKLDDNTNLSRLASDLPLIVQKYSPDQGISLRLQPMQEIHLTSQLVNEIKVNGNEKVVWLLTAVAVLILLLACTNYINFALAKAIKRHKEVGIRKIFWANSVQLFRQLITEAFLLNALALLLALTILQLSATYISSLMGIDAFKLLTKASSWYLICSILILITLISGLYPACYMAKLRPRFLQSVQPVEALSQQTLRKSLVAFQFMISILTLGFALVLYQQMEFMKSKKLGMDINHTLVIRGTDQGTEQDSIDQQRIQRFKSELERMSQIEEVAMANFIPGKEIRGQALNYVRRVGDPEANAANYYFTQLGYNFIDQLDLRLLAGREFDPERDDNESVIIINQEACRLLGFATPQQAIGEQIIYRMDHRPVIIGVVDDFHQLSLQRAFQPIIFEANKTPKAFYYLRLSEQTKLTEIRYINRLWQQLFPESPFSYFFLDEYYAQQYQSEERFSSVFTAFALLAILIASLGFFGLSYYAATQKIREIGIRKTLGASFKDILTLLGKGSLSYLMLSALLALPLIYFFAEQWLSYYAFRIEVAWWMLILPPVLLFVISLQVILFQSLRTYRLNPVETLREE